MSNITNFKYYENSTMSISKFMAHYYNINEKKLNRLSHKELEKVFPEIKKSKRRIESKSIATGETIMVRDGKGIVLGYENPFTTNYYNEHFEEYKSPQKPQIDIFQDSDIKILNELCMEDINDLSDYELYSLMKLSKKYNKTKNQNYARKLLRSRTKENQGDKKRIREKIEKQEYRKEM